MTLVLTWRHENTLTVIADTLFRARSRVSLEIGPKIFLSQVRLSRISHSQAAVEACAPVGFAFAGHTAAGQITQAIASGVLVNLTGGPASPSPTIREIAALYGRCGVHVANQIRRQHPNDDCSFEGVVFGWQVDAPEAYSVTIGIDHSGDAQFKIDLLDFTKYGLYSFGNVIGPHEVVRVQC